MVEIKLLRVQIYLTALRDQRRHDEIGGDRDSRFAATPVCDRQIDVVDRERLVDWWALVSWGGSFAATPLVHVFHLGPPWIGIWKLALSLSDHIERLPLIKNAHLWVILIWTPQKLRFNLAWRQLFNLIIESRTLVLETFIGVIWTNNRFLHIADRVTDQIRRILIATPFEHFPVLVPHLLLLLPIAFNQRDQLFLADCHQTWYVLANG